MEEPEFFPEDPSPEELARMIEASEPVALRRPEHPPHVGPEDASTAPPA